MAEVLVLNGDRVKAKDLDILAIQDDGFAWGSKEGPPNHHIVYIPGKTKEQLKYLLERHYEQPHEFIRPAFEKIPKLANNLRSNYDRKKHHKNRYKMDPITREITDKSNEFKFTE